MRNGISFDAHTCEHRSFASAVEALEIADDSADGWRVTKECADVFNPENVQRPKLKVDTVN